jgi:catechol 2,3-dioxygenase-like lactoylglutathione lyase family enzyme
MPRKFDHIDLRVRNIEAARRFYEVLLPALGFKRDAKIDGWLQFESCEDTCGEFFGVTESANHMPNENRIALRAEGRAEVDRLAGIARSAGALKVEGPAFEAPDYYAVFFDDPSANRFEICVRGVIDGGAQR